MLSRLSTLLCFALPVFLAAVALGQGSHADYERSAGLRERRGGKVFRHRIEPHWFHGNSRMWYRNTTSSGGGEFVLVDASKSERRAAFDHKRLASSLGKTMGKSVDAAKLPFHEIAFDEQLSAVQFAVDGKTWSCNLSDYDMKSVAGDQVIKPAKSKSVRDRVRSGGPGRGPQDRSPDGRWQAFLKDRNVFIRDLESKAEFRLSKDGSEEHYYEARFYWSPDSRKLVASKTRQGATHTVYLIESSPKDQLQPKLHSMNYQKPGDRIPLTKPCLFHVDDKRAVEIDDGLFPNPWAIRHLRWSEDSQRFTFLYNQRGHQVLRVVAVDADTGETGALIDEQSKTFLDYAHKEFTYFLDDTHEIIWMSERDGWNHLHLYDSRTGQIKNQITKGPWVVRGVDRIDAEKRRIWFRAGGVFPEQNPYYIHYCRVDFDGDNFVVLTRGNGSHEISYSPDHRYLIDRFSRVDEPQVHELRDAESGKLLCRLEQSDIKPLLETGWRPPERFVAKGRDGTTDIHGVIFRPTNFSAEKKYPIIEKIYAGPHGSFVPRTFASMHSAEEIAELGFVVVQIDGMGTSHRSKAFHDVCWKNLGDSGFPDRKLWIRAAAEKYPYMDIERVGVYGGSAGGQSSTRAMLAHPDFYKVAVSDCGCHDNRMDKIWWNELWMSWPIGPHYAEQSNVTNARKLEGKLLLIVGELDRNVDPASTMQVVNALIKADKDFDMLVIPGGGHGIGGAYGQRRRKDFFVRHLLGVEPRWK